MSLWHHKIAVHGGFNAWIWACLNLTALPVYIGLYVLVSKLLKGGSIGDYVGVLRVQGPHQVESLLRSAKME